MTHKFFFNQRRKKKTFRGWNISIFLQYFMNTLHILRVFFSVPISKWLDFSRQLEVFSFTIKQIPPPLFRLVENQVFFFSYNILCTKITNIEGVQKIQKVVQKYCFSKIQAQVLKCYSFFSFSPTRPMGSRLIMSSLVKIFIIPST